MKIQIKLKSTTKPKFMHNAGKAGTLPKWTFEFEDLETHKKGSVTIDMTRNMTKDEPTAKKMMAAAAVAEVKKHYPKAEVSVVTSTL